MRLLKAPLVFLISKVEIRMFHFRDGRNGPFEMSALYIPLHNGGDKC